MSPPPVRVTVTSDDLFCLQALLGNCGERTLLRNYRFRYLHRLTFCVRHSYSPCMDVKLHQVHTIRKSHSFETGQEQLVIGSEWMYGLHKLGNKPNYNDVAKWNFSVVLVGAIRRLQELVKTIAMITTKLLKAHIKCLKTNLFIAHVFL